MLSKGLSERKTVEGGSERKTRTWSRRGSKDSSLWTNNTASGSERQSQELEAGISSGVGGLGGPGLPGPRDVRGDSESDFVLSSYAASGKRGTLGKRILGLVFFFCRRI